MYAFSNGADLENPMVNPYCVTCACPKLTRAAPQARYKELSLVFHIYVYLRQLQRGGGAHVVGGLSTLSEGALAVECPACPHPGRNIELSREKLITRPP